ncbi:hypothetical protein HV241_10015 [Citrobacter freundii]|jgi:hypothetical protein|uniref:hypothetical protein n=1 Tax=Citrobacter freundii TaxID=546 RepID=UPI0015EAFB57|nr:hypothetical protein [Citrobacter freundii]QLY69347.1 hypothetical protein HV241_10015 [Citrobacter freundii]
MTLEQRVEILERTISGLKKSTSAKEEALALDKTNGITLDFSTKINGETRNEKITGSLRAPIKL